METEKRKKGITVYIGGTFDVLTPGHIDLFWWARALSGDNGRVVVALNSDEFVSRFKSHPTTMCFEERKALLEALKGLVDEVVENLGNEDSKPAILKIRPDIVMVGSDWLRKDYLKQMGFTPEWLEKHRIALCYIPRTIDVSSTSIKERIRK